MDAVGSAEAGSRVVRGPAGTEEGILGYYALVPSDEIWQVN
jgi:hypothetical protein